VYSTQVAAPQTQLGTLEVAFRSAPIGLCVLDLDFRYLIVNPCFTRMYGLREGDFLGRTVEEALPEPASQILAHMREALEEDGVVEREIALQDPSAATGGSAAREVIFLRTAQPVGDSAGMVFGVAVALLDITERKRLDCALQASEEDLRYTVELTPHIPWTADPAGEITFISPRWNPLVGQAPGPVLLEGWAKVVHPADLNTTSSSWFDAVRSGKPYDAEYRIRTPHGGWRWVRARAYPRRLPNGDILRWYGTVEDIHERKTIGIELQDATRELARRALQDHLTGLANRRQFDQVLLGEIERAQRTMLPLALVLIDIDHFKIFNDIAGHLLGDECLKTVARTLADIIQRPTDLVARFGGEEFAIVLPDTEPEGALLVAERAVAAIADLQLHHSDPRVCRVTISAGVAMHRRLPDVAEVAASMPDLIARADAALYRAKSEGRNCVGSAEAVPS
jgi:diguanylate cyclase (GGDEF)-like protein/PAS domain S-box-containing protein